MFFSYELIKLNFYMVGKWATFAQLQKFLNWTSAEGSQLDTMDHPTLQEGRAESLSTLDR